MEKPIFGWAALAMAPWGTIAHNALAMSTPRAARRVTDARHLIILLLLFTKHTPLLPNRFRHQASFDPSPVILQCLFGLLALSKLTADVLAQYKRYSVLTL